MKPGTVEVYGKRLVRTNYILLELIPENCYMDEFITFAKTINLEMKKHDL